MLLIKLEPNVLKKVTDKAGGDKKFLRKEITVEIQYWCLNSDKDTLLFGENNWAVLLIFYMFKIHFKV